MSTAGWKPALVAVDEFFGPYPALIPADHADGATWWPRFTQEVIRRIAAATTAITGAGDGPAVLVSGDLVLAATIRGGTLQPGKAIAADPDGLYALDAPAGEWAVVDTGWTRTADDCECGTCPCPPECDACGEPIGGGHTSTCVWRHGSAPWEKPVIPAASAVLDAHRHEPGCLFVRRRPGSLFLPGHPMCLFCGATGTQSTHTIAAANGTVTHHQRCRRCHQAWFADNCQRQTAMPQKRLDARGSTRPRSPGHARSTAPSGKPAPTAVRKGLHRTHLTPAD